MERKRRVLAAEDEPVSRQYLKSILELFGVETDLATNGKEAVEMWEEGSYDLILMDVQMPVLDGLEATRLIREKEGTRGGHTPIVGMTGHTDHDARCRAAGMDGSLLKPVNLLDCPLIRDLVGDASKQGEP